MELGSIVGHRSAMHDSSDNVMVIYIASCVGIMIYPKTHHILRELIIHHIPVETEFNYNRLSQCVTNMCSVDTLLINRIS